MLHRKFLHQNPGLLLLLLLSTAIIISGCNKKPKTIKPPPYVTTAIVEQYDVPIYIDAIGQALAPVSVQVRPQVQGKLIATTIEQGAIVNKGDILYMIDPRPYQAILEEAKAQWEHDKALLDIANKTVERYKTVVEGDFISLLTWEQYESNATAAQAQVELDKAAISAAQLNVDFCNVVAPVSGKISYSNVYVGNILVAYDPNYITIILPFDPITIQFSVSQQQFELIRNEQGNEGIWPFLAFLPENPKVVFEGKTYFIDNQINQNTGTILAKGTCPNATRKVWPGEFVKVKVLNKVAKQALVVPPGAILIGKDGAYLYTVNSEGVASAHTINVLTRTEKYIAVESDAFKKGDIVIIDGQINIAPGMAVNAVLQTTKTT